MNDNRSNQRRQGDLPRRAFLGNMGTGLSGLALTALLERDGLGAGSRRWRPPSGKAHFPPKAKSVIWLFMRGGFSHLETFDPKPALTKFAGKSISETPWKYVQDPKRLKKVRVVALVNDTRRNKLYETQVGFKKYGQSGIEVSDWFPHTGGCIDDISVIRSMWTTDDNHGAQVQFLSGRHMLDGRFPTIGAWINYGLGSLNDDLPQFIIMGPRYFSKRDGYYLGPAYDAVPLKIDPANPLAYAKPELDVSREEQQIEFAAIHRLNQLKMKEYPRDATLRARIKSYELAFRMQTAVPEVINFENETKGTQALYGLDNPKTKPFGMQLLAARRFVEQGTRFVQIMHGAGAAGAWDSHSNLKTRHAALAAQVDRPVAGLLKDLKRRGLLDETIVVFATEFGRTIANQPKAGKEPIGFAERQSGEDLVE